MKCFSIFDDGLNKFAINAHLPPPSTTFVDGSNDRVYIGSSGLSVEKGRRSVFFFRWNMIVSGVFVCVGFTVLKTNDSGSDLAYRFFTGVTR